MSRITKVLNHYENDNQDPEFHFVDDLGKEYTLSVRLEWIKNYFDGHPHYGSMSEVELDNLDYFMFYPYQKMNSFFMRYVNADFMNWKAVVELENAN